MKGRNKRQSGRNRKKRREKFREMKGENNERNKRMEFWEMEGHEEHVQ